MASKSQPSESQQISGNITAQDLEKIRLSQFWRNLSRNELTDKRKLYDLLKIGELENIVVDDGKINMKKGHWKRFKIMITNFSPILDANDEQRWQALLGGARIARFFNVLKSLKLLFPIKGFENPEKHLILQIAKKGKEHRKWEELMTLLEECNMAIGERKRFVKLLKENIEEKPDS